MTSDATESRPLLAAARRGRVPARTVGVILVDLTRHVAHGFLSTHRAEAFTPPHGFPPGTNIEIHIGHAQDVLRGDPTLYEIARTTSGCTVVVKGYRIEGVHAVQAELDRLYGYAPAPERHGCKQGSCELLYGPLDLERNSA